MTITLIGAGNVGYHLGKRLYKKGLTIHQVFSREIKHAEFLAKKVKGVAVTDLTNIDAQADLYIIAVRDDSISEVVAKLRQNKGMNRKLVVHTSGAANSQLIAPYFKRYGVFYPLQTFSKSRKVKFATIPICVDAGRKKDLKMLLKIGGKISEKVTKITDEERAVLHVAAVMVNNFSNHLFHLGQQITVEAGVDFGLLKPLILETVLKISQHTPYDMQTGPARRNDEKTIKKHLEYLQKFPEFVQLYTLLTKSIQHAYRR